MFPNDRSKLFYQLLFTSQKFGEWQGYQSQISQLMSVQRTMSKKMVRINQNISLYKVALLAKYSLWLSTPNSLLVYQAQLNTSNIIVRTKQINLPMIRQYSKDQINHYESNTFSHPQKHKSELFNPKQYTLKKSIFNPPRQLAEIYASRRHIPGIAVPEIDILHNSPRWLLVKTSRPDKQFFANLSLKYSYNPYDQLLKIFNYFVSLVRKYGYFRPTEGMIQLHQNVVRVWINEDVFSITPSTQLSDGLEGQTEFVLAFLAMVETNLHLWQRANGVTTIQQTVKLLEWRSKLARKSYTAINASQQPHFLPSQSGCSFDRSEYNENHMIAACRSNQDCQFGLDALKQQLSCSMTIKQEELNSLKPKSVNQLIMHRNNLKHSLEQKDDGKVKKKFALTSTSSTLQKFSQKFRSTITKKKKDRIQYLPDPVHEPISIQNQLQGLFWDECPGLGEETNNEELERIAQEIEQVLIW